MGLAVVERDGVGKCTITIKRVRIITTGSFEGSIPMINLFPLH